MDFKKLNEDEQTILSDEDKEYLTKRFSKMYKEDVVPTLINEVQHLLEVCDWYKSKEFTPMKVNGFLFGNKIEWEPCTIEEVQNDVGRKNLLVYLDRVSSGIDSLSTKTLKSRKDFIGSNSIEYKIEFKKDYKRI